MSHHCLLPYCHCEKENSFIFQMYGFVEKFLCNKYDTVDIELSLLFDDDGNNSAPSCAPKKMKWLDKESKT